MTRTLNLRCQIVYLGRRHGMTTPASGKLGAQADVTKPWPKLLEPPFQTAAADKRGAASRAPIMVPPFAPP